MQPVTHNTVQLKRINVELVRNTLKSLGVATKASIARTTTLSVATCSTILNELLQTGEVIESDSGEFSGGRPAKQYQYNAGYAYVLLLIVRTEGGIHAVTAVLANMLGESVMEETLTYSEIDAGTIEALLERYIADYPDIQAVGIGIPGVARGGVIGICDVPALSGMDLGGRLEDKYGLKVTIENDMNLTIYGFYRLQNYDEEKTLAIVTFPRNHFPGAGFIVEGRILAGSTRFGGEVSYLPFGMSRAEQLQLMHTRDGFVEIAVKTLISIIAIINPVSIVLTGDLFREHLLKTLEEACRREIPAEHMPQLILRQDIQPEYLSGLTAMTLESLAYHLQLIERR
ncbi:ROK family protein [Paenibacillus tengchongensis]|uniref:ROK family protein n=1 Tax=Paenibacillus tengchongensis TaxID=2608684 RepID=UPI00124C235E|nr:ROK family protein [Paenibacillus tengchongensis]